MNYNTVLVIDDELPIRKMLEVTLTSNNFNFKEAQNAKEGLMLAAGHTPDIILLDLGLPDEDGQVVLKKLRLWYQKPIIILSVRNSENDIISALDNGANDYLTKPFRTGELLARIRTSLRMHNHSASTSVFESNGLKVDIVNHLVTKHGTEIKLTITEFSLLGLFIRNESRVLTHSYILKEIWGIGNIEQTQYLRVFIAQLRKKIEDEPNNPKFIKTESGIGYRFIG